MEFYYYTHPVFLLTELLLDLKEMSNEFGLNSTPKKLTHTYQLKNMLLSRFEDRIKIVTYGKRDAVISKDVDPLAYSYATIKGSGLCENDIIKAFSNLVRKKLADKEPTSWPPTPNEFLQDLDNSKPLQCIYNAIIWSSNPRRKVNENGYAEAFSFQQAEKTAAITECWESIVSNIKTPNQTALSLTLHQITGSKEATVLLNRCGMGMSYTDVRLLTNEWGKGITRNYKTILRRQFNGNKSAHVSFDNSDGKQQTLTGHNTTHHTTGTIFQPRQKVDGQDEDENFLQSFQFDDSSDEEEIDYGSYKIPKKRKSMESFPEFSDQFADSELLTSQLHRDMAWGIVNAIGFDCLKEVNNAIAKDSLGNVGSWTAFMKNTCEDVTNKANIEYLPVIPKLESKHHPILKSASSKRYPGKVLQLDWRKKKNKKRKLMFSKKIAKHLDCW